MTTRDETSVVGLLRDARELISDEDKWCKGAYALDAKGHVATPTAAEAYQWCLVGALEMAGRGWSQTALNDALYALKNTQSQVAPYHQPLSLFNDSHTHEAVLALIDATIARLGPTPVEGNEA